MDGFITALTGTNGITAAAFTAQLTSLVPWLVTIIPISFGYYVLKKSVKSGSKAKVRI